MKQKPNLKNACNVFMSWQFYGGYLYGSTNKNPPFFANTSNVVKT